MLSSSQLLALSAGKLSQVKHIENPHRAQGYKHLQPKLSMAFDDCTQSRKLQLYLLHQQSSCEGQDGLHYSCESEAREDKTTPYSVHKKTAPG